MKHKTLTLLVFSLLLGLLLAGCSPDYTELSWKAIEQPTEQAAESPFGPEAYDVHSLEVFKDQLYAGLNLGSNGARISRSDDGETWEFVSENAFGYPIPEAKEITYWVLDLEVFQDQLYAGVNWYGEYGESLGAQVWRSKDGTQWENVVEGGFGDPDFAGVTSFAVFEDQIYAAIDAFYKGFQVWRSPSGDPGSWIMVAEDSLGYPNAPAAFLTPFKDKLVLVATSWAQGYGSTPVMIWVTQDGETWNPVTTDGFGVSATAPSHPVIFKDTLYLGAGAIWNSKNGLQWTLVQTEGFESTILNFSALFTDGKTLFANVTQGKGIFLYYSADGQTWKKSQEASHGYNNQWGIGYNPTAVFKGNLYFGGSTGQGTSEDVTNFAQVWCLDCE